jgi:hypothetical protein
VTGSVIKSGSSKGTFFNGISVGGVSPLHRIVELPRQVREAITLLASGVADDPRSVAIHHFMAYRVPPSRLGLARCCSRCPPSQAPASRVRPVPRPRRRPPLPCTPARGPTALASVGCDPLALLIVTEFQCAEDTGADSMISGAQFPVVTWPRLELPMTHSAYSDSAEVMRPLVRVEHPAL